MLGKGMDFGFYPELYRKLLERSENGSDVTSEKGSSWRYTEN